MPLLLWGFLCPDSLPPTAAILRISWAQRETSGRREGDCLLHQGLSIGQGAGALTSDSRRPMPRQPRPLDSPAPIIYHSHKPPAEVRTSCFFQSTSVRNSEPPSHQMSSCTFALSHRFHPLQQFILLQKTIGNCFI